MATQVDEMFAAIDGRDAARVEQLLAENGDLVKMENADVRFSLLPVPPSFPFPSSHLQ